MPEWPTARREDGRGLYLLEWTLSGEGGEKTEFAYRRAGRFKEHAAAATVIDVVFYDADGTPVGGKILAEWKDGSWTKK